MFDRFALRGGGAWCATNGAVQQPELRGGAPPIVLTQDVLLVERALTVLLSTLHTVLRAVSARQYHALRDRLVICSNRVL